MNTNTVEMNEAKAVAKKSLTEAAGVKFTTPTGALGVVLAEPSVRGKPQAELTCTEPGCTELHVREVSDWHQCGKCRTHAKKKGGSGGGSKSSSGGGSSVQGLMKILDTDSDEVRAMKQEANEVLLKVREAEKAKKEAEKAQAAEARKAQQEAQKAAAEEQRKAKAADALKARLAKIRQVAAEKGIEVSAKTEVEAEG